MPRPLPGAGLFAWLQRSALELLAGRIEISALSLVVLVVFYLATTQNFALAHAVVNSLPSPFTMQEWRIVGSVAITLVNLLFLMLVPFSAPRVVKPLAIAMLLTAAVCSYFMDTFGAVIDKSMIQNVARTDAHEAGDLLHGWFWLHVAMFGLLPAAVVQRLRVRRENAWPALARRAGLVLGILVLQLAVLGLQYNALSFWGRNHREIRLLINPFAPVNAAIRYVGSQLPKGRQKPLQLIAADAVLAAPARERPLLVVWAVGETARAENFELNGYRRPTNAALAKVPDLINYDNASSCGTATAVSVPCMFSGMKRAQYKESRAERQENLLDVFARLHLGVQWWDNNSGCQGVCKRIESVRLDNANDPAYCDANGCKDGILLKGLDGAVPAAGQSKLLVLHMQGSHGPAYFKRYPESARVFTPDCRDENVQRCSHEEVVNAYDNTLAYSDSVLADLIARLRQRQDVDSVVIYVSDHGESLGENGIYLHGLPYSIAPSQQTHVPLIAWFSDGARRSLGVDLACVQRGAEAPVSQDNLFHTVLGLFSVQTSAYEKDEDLFASCRKAAPALAGDAAPAPAGKARQG
ncbi:phosphoethanolamine transferase [Solimonas flava]|uniref:phosphoethanolamine transferase n=1 Tax=Solimonas flava TaxID=415849 RepID=UPI0004017FE9|nr:phosphoethanolamine--lipid A transferase [Solimonas flava]